MIPRIAGLLLALVATTSTTTSIFAHETRRQYLSGKGIDDAVPWEFFCSAGDKSGEWTTIPVPSCWDARGLRQAQLRSPAQRAAARRMSRESTAIASRSPPTGTARRSSLVFEGVDDRHAGIRSTARAPGRCTRAGSTGSSYDVTKLIKFGEREPAGSDRRQALGERIGQPRGAAAATTGTSAGSFGRSVSKRSRRSTSTASRSTPGRTARSRWTSSPPA